MTRLYGLLRRDEGMTLIELMTTLIIGSVVMLALFALVDQAFPAEQKVRDRVAAEQRGRIALERLSRDLRSAVCVAGTGGALQAPLISAGDTQVTFYTAVPAKSAIDDADATNDFVPEIHQLVYDPVAKTLTRKRWTFTGVPPDPSVTPANQPDDVLLTDVEPSGTANTLPGHSSAVFGLIPEDGTTPLDPSTMTAAQKASVARVRVGVRVAPRNGTTYAPAKATFEEDVTMRLPPAYSGGTAVGGPACQV
ncbi:MAG: prepilin-type N-terminal cleavage/methylation domain-containing protein [Actinobacteria bacterium]|nr:MAG: prepilin-type N-terminal cleavage/methylation domain-containing protein [Actinomycetota bacterium]